MWKLLEIKDKGGKQSASELGIAIAKLLGNEQTVEWLLKCLFMSTLFITWPNVCAN